jgi:hypothetical protein
MEKDQDQPGPIKVDEHLIRVEGDYIKIIRRFHG